MIASGFEENYQRGAYNSFRDGGEHVEPAGSIDRPKTNPPRRRPGVAPTHLADVRAGWSIAERGVDSLHEAA